jgi:large subunit ribosomal protein L24
MKTIDPGKQRKEIYNAPLHRRRRMASSHLEENLLLKYDKRAVSIVKGDTVKVMRGSFKGHEDKVVKVNIKKNNIEIEGITLSKADGNKIAKPIHPSNVLITKLNLTDKWRRKKLERGLSEETKKEIEKEAETQIKEAEEEQKRIEAEEKALEEAEKEMEEEIPEEPEKPEEKPKKEEKKETKPAAKQKPKAEKKTETKKTPAKKPAKPKTATKKPAAKKTPAKKETAPKKKTTAKKPVAKKEVKK